MKKRNKTNQFLLLNPDQLFQELSIKKNIKNQLVCLYDWIKHIFFKYVNNRWEKEIIQTSSPGLRLNKRSLFEYKC